MDTLTSDFVRVCNLSELQEKGRLVIHGRHTPILLIHEGGRVFALDNRCPHMGFPLDRGSVEDGILTCHCHHARFDLASGCTFDLWADDIPTCPVEIRGGAEVWVKPSFGYVDPKGHWRTRLDDGLAHNLGLVIAKAVHGQLAAGELPTAIIQQAVLFGVRNREDWGTGLTILTALGNVLPVLSEEQVHLALFHGVRRVAADCEGQAPRRDRAPLASRPDLEVLRLWLIQWSRVRHREGAERTLATAIATGATPAQLADLLVSVATDRIYADAGHSLDFVNKALECLDLIGWNYAALVLPSVVGQIVAARGAEETTSWRHPLDLVVLCRRTAMELPALFDSAPRIVRWTGHAALANELLSDDPVDIMEHLKQAVRTGAKASDLSLSLAYAAALRVARFGTANEHSDWETAHHVFTYSNAVHQALRRIEGSGGRSGAWTDAVQGILHGAMAVYLARFLNVPPARLPDEDERALDDLPGSREELRKALLDAFDRQRQADLAGRLVARHLSLGYTPEDLIDTLGTALLREDASFHAYQMVEAGVRQFQEWGNTREGRHILVAVARYLAAHFPTERAAYQTADIARRLLRGGELHR